jgi:hypothetical protein
MRTTDKTLVSRVHNAKKHENLHASYPLAVGRTAPM